MSHALRTITSLNAGIGETKKRRAHIRITTKALTYRIKKLKAS